MYNFGLYHWRERLRSILAGLAPLALSALLWRTRPFRYARSLAAAAAFGAIIESSPPILRLLRPPPWAIERYKYDALAAELPFEYAGTALDIGCGTGRSLVGIAPHLPKGCSVIGLDVFDDRVILGNAPLLARRNAFEAGIEVAPVQGDAARLPLAENSQDVVTACRVLHDLPEGDEKRALREARRVCTPDGTLGVLELPITSEGVDTDPEIYWRERVERAGFEITRIKRVERRQGGEPYIVIVAEPSLSGNAMRTVS